MVYSRNKRIIYMLLVLSIIIAIGAAGYQYFCDIPWIDAFFYSATTITTVGFEAPPGLTPEGKIFTILFLIFGISGAAYVLGHLTEKVVVERVMTALGKRRDRRMDSLRDHWIICGLGRIGKSVAETLQRDEIPFISIDHNPETCERCRNLGWFVVQGDAREESILELAGIHRATGLIVALDNDANSVYVTLSARAENPKLRIVSRANESQSVNVLYRSGADKVLNPLQAGAAAIAKAAVSPAAADFLELINVTRQINLRFDSVRISGDSPFVGKALADTPIRSKYNLLVVAVKKSSGDVLYNPSGKILLEEGDELVFLGEPEQIPKARAEATGQANFQHATGEQHPNPRPDPTSWPH